MIGRLKGIIDQISGNQVILDVNGVGYVVHCGTSTLRQIGMAGEAATLLIETVVREDAITLYGFAEADERHWFKTLTTVQGVGPKVCLSILSACTPDQLLLAIGARDHVPLTRADGVGPKLAQRIVMELKDKNFTAPAIALPPSPESKQKRAKPANDTAHIEDAVSALVNLGYGRSEAFTAVNAVIQRGDTKDLSAIISQSLKELAA